MDKSKCCGCTACASVCPKQCIEMKEDEEGFLYPYVHMDFCIKCGFCEKVCMMYSPIKEKAVSQKAFLIQHQDQTVLRESTSGGAFTAISECVIAKKGVVFGAAYDENFEVHHIWVDTAEELYKFRNSKYVQSRIGSSFQEVKDFLNSGRLVCFSGTPCQIEGLYHYLGKRYNNLILIDIVCHGIPSPLIWKKYKNLCLHNEYKSVRQIQFRNKDLYGYEYSQMAFLREGQSRYMGIECDPYLRAFFSDLSDRPSCYQCPVKKRYRISDLTLWDCFDVYKFNKDLDDNRGVTRVLVHSSKGMDYINQLQHCKVFEIDADLAVLGVKEMVKPVSYNVKREAFFADAIKMQDKDFFEKYFPMTLKVRIEHIIRKVCNKLGIWRFVKRTTKSILRMIKRDCSY